MCPLAQTVIQLVPRDDHEDDFICPCCGADVRAGASFCRECGASDESGWTDDEDWSDDFDYDEYLRREFPERATVSTPLRIKRFITGFVVILLCITLLLWQFFS